MIVDTRGKLCPLPLILFRQALKDHPEETHFEILTDNAIACSNLMDFIRDQQFSYTETAEGDTTRLTVTVSGDKEQETPQEAPLLVPKPEDNTVVVLTHDAMGHGNDELGHILINSFLTALAEVNPLPKTIICYNTGALLATKESPVLAPLQKLESLGVQILVCGLCTDFLALKERLAVGRVSNMLSIAETINKASKIIYP